MENVNDRYYRDMIEGMDEDQAVNLAIAKVREAIEDTRQIRKHAERTLELISARQRSR